VQILLCAKIIKSGMLPSLFDQQLTELGMQRGKLIDAEEFELAWNLSIDRQLSFIDRQ
jgi:hypothetical protein